MITSIRIDDEETETWDTLTYQYNSHNQIINVTQIVCQQSDNPDDYTEKYGWNISYNSDGTIDTISNTDTSITDESYIPRTFKFNYNKGIISSIKSSDNTFSLTCDYNSQNYLTSTSISQTNDTKEVRDEEGMIFKDNYNYQYTYTDDKISNVELKRQSTQDGETYNSKTRFIIEYEEITEE